MANIRATINATTRIVTWLDSNQLIQGEHLVTNLIFYDPTPRATGDVATFNFILPDGTATRSYVAVYGNTEVIGGVTYAKYSMQIDKMVLFHKINITGTNIDVAFSVVNQTANTIRTTITEQLSINPSVVWTMDNSAITDSEYLELAEQISDLEQSIADTDAQASATSVAFGTTPTASVSVSEVSDHNRFTFAFTIPQGKALHPVGANVTSSTAPQVGDLDQIDSSYISGIQTNEYVLYGHTKTESIGNRSYIVCGTYIGVNLSGSKAHITLTGVYETTGATGTTLINKQYKEVFAYEPSVSQYQIPIALNTFNRTPVVGETFQLIATDSNETFAKLITCEVKSISASDCNFVITSKVDVKGIKGDTGNTGATPNISASASISGGVGTPSVSVSRTGTNENPTLTFSFTNLKGEKGDTGDAFQIFRTYSSIALMNADAPNVPEGKFVMITSNVEDVDNSKLYVKNGLGTFNYLTDMSGATGIQGETGATGNGISTISKTSTSGLVDTYTITFTNGNTSTFNVTNGNNGLNAIGQKQAFAVSSNPTNPSVSDYDLGLKASNMFSRDVASGGEYVSLVVTYNSQPYIIVGRLIESMFGSDAHYVITKSYAYAINGKGITSIAKTSTSGLTDTYTITYSDGTTQTYTITNGQNGTNGSDGQDGTDGRNCLVSAKTWTTTFTPDQTTIYNLTEEDYAWWELQQITPQEGDSVIIMSNVNGTKYYNHCSFVNYSASTKQVVCNQALQLTPQTQIFSATTGVGQTIPQIAEEYTFTSQDGWTFGQLYQFDFLMGVQAMLTIGNDKYYVTMNGLSVTQSGTTYTVTGTVIGCTLMNEDIPTKTSDLINDGNGSSAFATELYVNTYGGKIDKIKVNGTEQEITNKAVDLSVPTKTSDLTNDSGFISDASGKEDTSNKVTSISSSSTDTQYPSAKAVYGIKEDFVDGTTIVGRADNLKSESTTLTSNFNFRPTASTYTNGAWVGTSIETKDGANLKSIRGKSYVRNQLVQNGNFANGTSGWSTANCAPSVSNNIATLTYNGSAGILNFCRGLSFANGHKYLYCYDAKLSNSNIRIRISNSYGGNDVLGLQNTNWQNLMSIWQSTANGSYSYPQLYATNCSSGDTIQVKNINLIDLTKHFNGNANIPSEVLNMTTLDTTILAKYGIKLDGVYNAGEVENFGQNGNVTVDFNQLVDKTQIRATQTINGVTFTNNGDGTITANGTATGTTTFVAYTNLPNSTHKKILTGCQNGSNSTYALYNGYSNYDIGNGTIYQGGETVQTQLIYIYIIVWSGVTVNNVIFTPQVFDLTQMFGSGNEPSTVEEFRELYPNDYYDYTTSRSETLSLVKINTTGFNAWDEETEVGGINSTSGATESASDRIRSKNFCKCLGNTTYYVKGSAYVFYYDNNQNFISYAGQLNNETFTTPSNASYFKVVITNTTEYQNNICINLSWSGTKNGLYETYTNNIKSLPIATYFPNGMCSIGNVYDELTERKATQRIKIGTISGGIFSYTPRTNTCICMLAINDKIPNPTYISNILVDNTELPLLTPDGNWYNDIVGICEICNVNLPYITISLPISEFPDTETVNNYLSNNPITLYYQTKTPVETNIDIDLSYTCNDWGTEQLISTNSVPLNADIVYGLDVKNEVKNLRQNYISLPSFNNLANEIKSEYGITITQTFGVDQYNFAITGTPKINGNNVATIDQVPQTASDNDYTSYINF